MNRARPIGTDAAQVVPGAPLPTGVPDRLLAFEAELKALAGRALEQSARLDSMETLVRGAGQKEMLSLVVFSGSLDRLIAAFVLATGAAAMGMKVSMFFTFWATAALRKDTAAGKRVAKTMLERMFGWMLPRGTKSLPLRR